MKRLTILLAVIAVTLLFFHKLAFTDLILARGDAYQYFYPLWAARDAALSQGRLPLWTPDVFMGAPLLSDPQLGTLYPPNWLTIGMIPPDAIRISILIHVTWATCGAFVLARRVVSLDLFPALAAGALYGLGGYIGAHVEQINQLQGLAWIPWAVLALALAREKPLRYGGLLAMILALQVFSGHTQTVFMTVVALGVVGLIEAMLNNDGRGKPRPYIESSVGTRLASSVDGLIKIILRFNLLFTLALAGLAAVILALPQLYPTLELTGLSNRGSGLNPLQAMAFSWTPALAARGLLPSYDAQIFGEYIATFGVIGLGLMLVGAANVKRSTGVWLVLAIIGIVFALGAYTPVYWTVAGLPGFNLFRVPARWLALFALGGAMLAGLGAQTLLMRRPSWRILTVVMMVIVLLAASTFFATYAAAEVNGPAQPTLVTLAGWGVAALVLAGLIFRRVHPALITLALVAELFAASWVMPFNDLVDRAAYEDARFSVYQLKAFYDDHHAPGRMLSISNGYFDPGDKAGLAARYAAMGMNQRAADHAFTAAKLKELVAANLPMTWNIPSIDGFGGGLVPTVYYTQFTSLLLPDGMPRTVDGRLRENLALQSCRGACIPERRWLNLTNTRYLITDKTFDFPVNGIFFDTAFTLSGAFTIDRVPQFEADALHVLYRGETPPSLQIGGEPVPMQAGEEVEAGINIARVSFPLQTFDALTLESESVVVALTLVDSRTGDFAQVTPWRRVLSSDIKMYENDAVLPRAFVVVDVETVEDSWDGSERALEMMRAAEFEVGERVIIHTETDMMNGVVGEAFNPTPHPSPNTGRGIASPMFGGGWVGVLGQLTNSVMHHTPTGTTQILDYHPEHIEINVNTPQDGYLFLSDAYYPGWKVTVNGEPAELYRANVMFRAVPVPAGESTVVFTYAPDWMPAVFIVGGIGWLLVVLIVSIKTIKL